MSLPPPAVSTSLSPSWVAAAGPTLTCNPAITDACSALIPDAITYKWTVNGTAQATTAQTFSTAGLHASDQVTCTATVAGEGGSTTATSAALAVPATTWTLTGSIADGKAGFSLAVIDDLNGDGYRELAIGAPNTSFGGSSRAGAVYLVNGQNAVDTTDLGQLVGALGKGGTFLPGQQGAYTVGTMACDSHAQYVGGCPSVNDVWAKSLRRHRWSRRHGSRLPGRLRGDLLDGDGVGDLIVSAPYDFCSMNLWQGRTFVVSGTHLSGAPFDDASGPAWAATPSTASAGGAATSTTRASRPPRRRTEISSAGAYADRRHQRRRARRLRGRSAQQQRLRSRHRLRRLRPHRQARPERGRHLPARLQQPKYRDARSARGQRRLRDYAPEPPATRRRSTSAPTRSSASATSTATATTTSSSTTTARAATRTIRSSRSAAPTGRRRRSAPAAPRSSSRSTWAPSTAAPRAAARSNAGGLGLAHRRRWRHVPATASTISSPTADHLDTGGFLEALYGGGTPNAQGQLNFSDAVSGTGRA